MKYVTSFHKRELTNAFAFVFETSIVSMPLLFVSNSQASIHVAIASYTRVMHPPPWIHGKNKFQTKAVAMMRRCGCRRAGLEIAAGWARGISRVI